MDFASAAFLLPVQVLHPLLLLLLTVREQLFFFFVGVGWREESVVLLREVVRAFLLVKRERLVVRGSMENQRPENGGICYCFLGFGIRDVGSIFEDGRHRMKI